MTGAISQNVGKLFSEVKIVTDNLFIYTEAKWYSTPTPDAWKEYPYMQKQIGCFNLSVVTMVAN